jgi:hypothetical protein
MAIQDLDSKLAENRRETHGVRPYFFDVHDLISVQRKASTLRANMGTGGAGAGNGTNSKKWVDVCAFAEY